MQIDEEFRHLLRGFDLDVLEEDGSTVVGVWADHRLAYTNAGWERFAEENGGRTLVHDWPLGRSILEAIPEALSPFYASGVERALRDRQPWTHTYECSGPTEYRLLRLELFPLAPDEDAEVAGFLYVHSPLLQEQWDPRPAVAPVTEEYLSDGLVVSCAHCWRFRRLSGALREWVFIPRLAGTGAGAGHPRHLRALRGLPFLPAIRHRPSPGRPCPDLSHPRAAPPLSCTGGARRLANHE